MDPGAPSSWLLARPGTEVLACDGQDVGSVKHVLAAEGEDLFEGLVIELRGGRQAFVDEEDVDGFFEHAVVLKLDGAGCDDLPIPQPAPGGLTATGDRPPPGPLQRKLHRAWELISGEG